MRGLQAMYAFRFHYPKFIFHIRDIEIHALLTSDVLCTGSQPQLYIPTYEHSVQTTTDFRMHELFTNDAHCSISQLRGYIPYTHTQYSICCRRQEAQIVQN